MASDRVLRHGADYHLDLQVDGGLLLLHVEGPDGPALRQHMNEVRSAAERCGLRLVVSGEKGEPRLLS